MRVMTSIKGDRLYVNLSANQTRRWLKGHGFGVRKIQSDGETKQSSSTPPRASTETNFTPYLRT